MDPEPRDEIKDLRAKDLLFDKELITVNENDKIQEVESLMIKKGIGGVPVIRYTSNSKKELVGMLTHRDIELARATINLGGMLVRDLMSHDVVTVNDNANLLEILKKMKEHNIARLPVTNKNGDLIGMIVHKNIIKKLYEILNKSG
ncbi:MAG: CBS domain-containing protein [Promethearchaeota archaeon]